MFLDKSSLLVSQQRSSNNSLKITGLVVNQLRLMLFDTLQRALLILEFPIIALSSQRPNLHKVHKRRELFKNATQIVLINAVVLLI